MLRIVLLATNNDNRAGMLLVWRGWAPGRDFRIGAHGIEVKATLGPSSRHRFSGIHQLEPQRLENSGAESLSLLSLGLQIVETGGPSLPELVDDLLSLLAGGGNGRNAQQGQLLTMIASYGGTDAPSYEHDAMRGWNVYQQRFAITFARLYDLSDPNMHLLDRNIVDQTFAVPESLSFELAVPSTLSAFNPAEDWQKEIATMARECAIGL